MEGVNLSSEDIQKVAEKVAEFKLTTIRVADVMGLAKSIAKLETMMEKEEIRSTAFQSGIVVGVFLTLGIVAVVLLAQGFV